MAPPRYLVLLLVLAAGCKSKPDCARSIHGAVDRMMAETKDKLPGLAYEQVAKAAPKIADIMIDACKEDSWPPEVLACIDAAGTRNALDQCNDKLAKPMKEKVEKAVKDALHSVLPGSF